MNLFSENIYISYLIISFCSACLNPQLLPLPPQTASISSSLEDPLSTTTPLQLNQVTPSILQKDESSIISFYGQGFASGINFQVPGAICQSLQPFTSTWEDSTDCSIPSDNCTLVSSTHVQCKMKASQWGSLPVSVTQNDTGETKYLAHPLTVRAPPPIINDISITSGLSSGNTLILMTGYHFLPGAIATFNQVSCLTTQLTNTNLYCTTPAAASGWNSVSVTNPDGQTDTLSNAFEYLSVPSAPKFLKYTTNPLYYPLSYPTLSPQATVIPSYLGSNLNFQILPTLPTGLTFNTLTGALSGSPSVTQAQTNYTVTAQNSLGQSTTRISIAITDFGSGNLGNQTTLANTSTIVNSYAALDTTANGGDMTLSVTGTATGFSQGDAILILQMQKSTSPLRWEIRRIDSPPIPAGLSTVIMLNQALTYSYLVSTTPVARAQIVKIPEYQDLTVSYPSTLSGSPWNPNQSTGGVIALRVAGTLQVLGSINATGLGFTGGLSSTAPTAGESWTGTNATSTQGAGGSSTPVVSVNCLTTSGGGGGYGTEGTAQGNSSAGLIFGTSSLSEFFLGPGGGGAGVNSSCSCQSDVLASGGSGGGFILIQAYQLIVGNTGSIVAQGQDRRNISSKSDCNATLAGAGAGGSIYLFSPKPVIGIRKIKALGGNLSNQGGSGRIRIDAGTDTFSQSLVTGYSDPTAYLGTL